MLAVTQSIDNAGSLSTKRSLFVNLFISLSSLICSSSVISYLIFLSLTGLYAIIHSVYDCCIILIIQVLLLISLIPLMEFYYIYMYVFIVFNLYVCIQLYSAKGINDVVLTTKIKFVCLL